MQRLEKERGRERGGVAGGRAFSISICWCISSQEIDERMLTFLIRAFVNEILYCCRWQRSRPICTFPGWGESPVWT